MDIVSDGDGANPQHQVGNTGTAVNGEQRRSGADSPGAGADNQATDFEDETLLGEDGDREDDEAVEQLQPPQQQQRKAATSKRKASSTRKTNKAAFPTLVNQLHEKMKTANQALRQDRTVNPQADPRLKTLLLLTDTGTGYSNSIQLKRAGAISQLGPVRLRRLQMFLRQCYHPFDTYGRTQALAHLDAAPINAAGVLDGNVSPAAVVGVLHMLKIKQLLPVEEVTRIREAWLASKTGDKVEHAEAAQAIADGNLVEAIGASEGAQRLIKRARKQMHAARDPGAAAGLSSLVLDLVNDDLPGEPIMCAHQAALNDFSLPCTLMDCLMVVYLCVSTTT
jgi:hypothetical protein